MSDSPSTPSIHGQLSTLLGREVKQLRKTDEVPPRVSIVDVAALITGKDKNQAAEDFRRLTTRYPDVKAKCFDVYLLQAVFDPSCDPSFNPCRERKPSIPQTPNPNPT